MAMAMLTHVGPWTEEDLLDLPDDGQRYEILDGTLIVSPPPAGLHQLAAFRLARILDDAAPAELAVVEGLGVRLPGGALVLDVMVADRAAVMAATGGFVPADAVHLVVEIVSPASKTMDRTSKPAAFADAGIGALWRVELDEGPAVHLLELGESGAYVEVAIARANDPLTLDSPFPLTLDAGRLLPS